MTVKHTAPYQGPPAWLDARHELPLDGGGMPEAVFAPAVMAACIAVGCSPRQAAEACANAMLEASRGADCYCNNPYGWKITNMQAEKLAGQELYILSLTFGTQALNTPRS